MILPRHHIVILLRPFLLGRFGVSAGPHLTLAACTSSTSSGCAIHIFVTELCKAPQKMFMAPLAPHLLVAVLTPQILAIKLAPHWLVAALDIPLLVAAPAPRFLVAALATLCISGYARSTFASGHASSTFYCGRASSTFVGGFSHFSQFHLIYQAMRYLHNCTYISEASLQK